MSDSLLTTLLARGLRSDLAARVASIYPSWAAVSAASRELLARDFGAAEMGEIIRTTNRKEIPHSTVKRLLETCDGKCCMCWDIDVDRGVVIHHIVPHATNPDDSYDNLVLLCPDHHSLVHTKWELARHPLPPDLLRRRKADFVAAIAAFRAGKRAAPGREREARGVAAVPPLPPSIFVGRDKDVGALCSTLATGSRRAAVIGMGGVGKTALAQTVAEHHRRQADGSVLWGEAGVARDIGDVTRTWLKAFGAEIDGVELDEQFRLLAQMVEGAGSPLLILDDLNADHVDDLRKLLGYLAQKNPMLITSRDASIAASIGAVVTRLEPLARTDCRQMLTAIADYVPPPSDDRVVGALIELLGELPLAVELVACQIRLLRQKPGFTLQALCDRLHRFDAALLSFPGHRGIAMSFALSYDELDAEEQRIFRLLGGFARGGMRLGDVAAVADISRPATESILDRLVTVSVANWGNGAGDYRLHPLLHQYAGFKREQEAADLRRQVDARFVTHFVAAAKIAAESGPKGLETIDGIVANFERAIRLGAEMNDHADVHQGVLAVSSTMSYYWSRNRERDSIALLELATTAARALGDVDGCAAHLNQLGSAYSRLGELPEAIRYYEESIATSCDDYDRASGYQNLGSALLHQGDDLTRAQKALRKGLELGLRSQHFDAILGCYSTLGSLHRQLGQPQEAARLYEAALKMARVVKNRLSESNNLSNLGLVLDQLGDGEKAEANFREALAIAKEIGDRRGEGNRVGHIGGMLMKKAQHLPPGPERTAFLEQATEHVSVALNLATETNDPEKIAIWTMNLGNISRLRDRLSEAIDQYQVALALAKERGFGLVLGQIHFNLGAVYVDRGQYDLARNHFALAHQVMASVGLPLAEVARGIIEHLPKSS